MLTLSIIQLILIVYCVWSYSFVSGAMWYEDWDFSDLHIVEKTRFVLIFLLSPITVWMLFIDND